MWLVLKSSSLCVNSLKLAQQTAENQMRNGYWILRMTEHRIYSLGLLPSNPLKPRLKVSHHHRSRGSPQRKRWGTVNESTKTAISLCLTNSEKLSASTKESEYGGDLQHLGRNPSSDAFCLHCPSVADLKPWQSGRFTGNMSTRAPQVRLCRSLHLHRSSRESMSITTRHFLSKFVPSTATPSSSDG